MVTELFTLPVILSALSLLLATLGFMYQRFKAQATVDTKIATLENDVSNIKKACEDIVKNDSKIDNIVERISKIEVKNEIVWSAVEQAVVNILHHPTKPKRDKLLEKLQDKSITLQEMEELKGMLTCVVIDKPSPDETIAAGLLLASINTKLFDAGKLHFYHN